MDPASGLVPVHIVASVNGPDRHPRDIAVAVNGTIQAVGNTFKLAVGNAGELVSVMVPESAFHKGRNDVQVLLQRSYVTIALRTSESRGRYRSARQTSTSCSMSSFCSLVSGCTNRSAVPICSAPSPRPRNCSAIASSAVR